MPHIERTAKLLVRVSVRRPRVCYIARLSSICFL